METSLNEPGRQPRPVLGSLLTRAMGREAPAQVVDAVVDWLARVDGSALDDADRISAVASLERLRGASAAAQARVTMSFARSTETLQPADDPPSEGARNRSIGLQLALARSESPSSGDGHLALARALTRDLPHTLRALTRGEISEEKAAAVHRATAHLAPDTRRAVDASLSPDLASHNRFQVGEHARRLADELDPEASVERARHEAGERRVSARSGRDGMGYLTIYGPMLDVAGAMASLGSYADSVAYGVVGDDTLQGRRRANVMTDHALEMLSGRRPGELQPVEVHVVVGAAGLFGHFASSGPFGAGWSDSPKGPETRNAAQNPGVQPSNTAEPPAPPKAGSAAATAPRPGTRSPAKAGPAPADLVRPVDPGAAYWPRPVHCDVPVTRDVAGAPSALIPGVGAMSSAALRAALGPGRDGPGALLATRRYADRQVWLRRLFTDASGTRLLGMDRRRRNLPSTVRQWIGRSEGDAEPNAQSGERLVPADAARWLRELGRPPDRGDLVAWSSPHRAFTGLLRRFLVLRDLRCRTPFCAAPIRDIDHVVPVRQGGCTHVVGGRGACRRCNVDKELNGWAFEVADGGLPGRGGGQGWDDVLDALLFDLENPSPTSPSRRHWLMVRTPTGHEYQSTAPPTAGPTPLAEPP